MAIFVKKSYIEWIRKNPGIHPSYCDFSSKMIVYASKWKVRNFSELSLFIAFAIGL